MMWMVVCMVGASHSQAYFLAKHQTKACEAYKSLWVYWQNQSDCGTHCDFMHY